jgi:serine/threonine protein kinase
VRIWTVVSFSPQAPGEPLLAGRYRLLVKLGRGAHGAVWRALDLRTGRAVAVKSLDLPAGDPDVFHRRIQREYQIVARAVAHPGVLLPQDVVQEDGRPWIVTEFVRGPSLGQVLAGGPLPWRQVAEPAFHVLDALRALHQAGVPHRSIKPNNILLGDRPRLTDLGLDEPALQERDPSYLAPERIEGELPTSRSDLWELGATLHTAVEGRAPYARPSPLSVLAAVLSEPVPRRPAPWPRSWRD